VSWSGIHNLTPRAGVTSFGETIGLESWQLQNPVEVCACQDFSVEDWWFALPDGTLNNPNLIYLTTLTVQP
jgi:hypothetical protein